MTRNTGSHVELPPRSFISMKNSKQQLMMYEMVHRGYHRLRGGFMNRYVSLGSEVRTGSNNETSRKVALRGSHYVLPDVRATERG